MMGFFPDLAAADAIDRAESDPEQAAEVLRLAAAYMRRGEALPYNLAEYLASAIEASMGKPESHRGGALLEELNLKARNRRPAACWQEVGEFMFWRTGFNFPDKKHTSQNTAATEAAVKFGISESTATRCYRRFVDDMEMEAKDQAEHAIRQEQLESERVSQKPRTF